MFLFDRGRVGNAEIPGGFLCATDVLVCVYIIQAIKQSCVHVSVLRLESQ